MKVVCEVTVLGVTALRTVTTPATGDQGAYVKAIVGVGKPFWAWPSIPAGKVIGADFDNAPICSASTVTNNALIAGITATPEEVLTYLE